MQTTAIVFENERNVQLRDITLPQPTESDIVVKTLLSGISVGTERWTYIGKRAEISFPNVPGYMSVGKIVTTGSKAAEAGYKKDELVYFGCSKMSEEFAGKSWMASHLADAVVDVISPLSNPDFFSVEPVPAGTDPADISLASLCAVSMRGIEMATIPAGCKVLICGLGVLGQYAAQVCRLKGAQICVTDVSESRCGIAAELGAQWIVNSKTDNLSERAAEIAPNGFDIIIDTSSIPAVVNSLWPLLKVYGKMIFQGWYPPPSGLDLNAAHVKMPTAYFPCGYSSPAVATCLRWMSEGHINTRKLITHQAKPQQAAEIYEMIANNSEDFLGITFDWS